MLSFFVIPSKVRANTYLCKYLHTDVSSGPLVVVTNVSSLMVVADDEVDGLYVCEADVNWSIFSQDIYYLVKNGTCSTMADTEFISKSTLVNNKCPRDIWHDTVKNLLCGGYNKNGCEFANTNSYYLGQSDQQTNEIVTGDSLIIGYFGGPESFGKLVYADSLFATSNCPSEEPVFKMISYFYSLLKIIVPVVLVLFGSIDIAKAVAASDDGAIKKATSSFLRKLVAGVIVFLLFEIVGFVINLVSENYGVMDCVNKIIGN